MRESGTRLTTKIGNHVKLLRGEPILKQREYDLGNLRPEDELDARVLAGDDIYDTTGVSYLTDEIVRVKKILGPLEVKDVPILRCIGLNYVSHVEEVGRRPTPYPLMFIKPSTSLTGHRDPVIVPRIAQDDQADYEGELCLIIGEDARDVPRDKGMEYIAAYTLGNDISSRKLQRDPNLAGNISQWCFSKGFDTFAPLGPCLVASPLIPDPSTLQIITKIDGQVRQNESVSRLCFDCSYLVSYLSQGTTLQKGGVIMTGTPGGIGMSMDPPQWLQDGTVMEVHIAEIGTLRNRVVFEKFS